MLFFPSHAGAYDDVKLCRRGNSLNDLMLSRIRICCNIQRFSSYSYYIIITLRFLFALFSFIATDFPFIIICIMLKMPFNGIRRNKKFTSLCDSMMRLLSLN